MSQTVSIPFVSVTYAQDGSSTRPNAHGMRVMQERAYQKRGEQYLLIKSPPASGKSRALMFIALDKLANQKIKQAIIVVPEKSIGASFHDEPLKQFGFWADSLRRPRHGQRRQSGIREEIFGERGQSIGLHTRHLPVCRGEIRRGSIR
jgi:hypothetical protein